MDGLREALKTSQVTTLEVANAQAANLRPTPFDGPGCLPSEKSCQAFVRGCLTLNAASKHRNFLTAKPCQGLLGQSSNVVAPHHSKMVGCKCDIVCVYPLKASKVPVIAWAFGRWSVCRLLGQCALTAAHCTRKA